MIRIKKKYQKRNFLLLVIVFVAMVLNFVSIIINGIYLSGITDELAILFFFATGFLFFIQNKETRIYQPDFTIGLTLLSLIYVIFYPETLVSFIYEYYKLMVFLAAVPLFRFFGRQDLKTCLLMLRRLFILVLAVNFVFIILQIYTDNQILAWIGYDEVRVTAWNRKGRFSGLFDVATLGGSALIMMLLNEMYPKRDWTYYLLHILAILSIGFSSSKTSYLILLCWIILFFGKYLLRHFIKIFAGIAVFLTVVIYYTYDAILSKVYQYTYLIQNIDSPQIVNLDVVGMRAMFYAQSIAIFLKNPFGLGFGTFGDTSAEYNPGAYKMPASLWEEQYVTLSDSSFSHLLAEQGVVTFLYLGLVIWPLVHCRGELRKLAWMLAVFYLIEILFTMGFSSGTWPLLFSVAYAVFYYHKKFNPIYEGSK